MSKVFRQGAAGALLDEYERSISDLRKVIEVIPDEFLATIIDAHTRDENCRSVGAILAHVVSAGYGYATSIYNWKGHKITRPEKVLRHSIREYLEDLSRLFSFTVEVFKEVREDELEQLDQSLKIITSWGQSYDIEQLTEHAIVHILRHRRQIEKARQSYLSVRNKHSLE